MSQLLVLFSPRTTALVLAAVCCQLFLCYSVRADQAVQFAQLWEEASDDHVPYTDDSFAPVREELRSAASALERRLGGNSSFAQGWKTYLRWSLLEPHFRDDVKITGQSLRDLDRVLRRFRKNQPGLEAKEFVRTAQALERYRTVARWYALAKRLDTRKRYTGFLRELEKQVTRNLEKPTVESTRQIGKVLGLLQHLDSSPQLVEQVGTQFERSNVLVEVSASAVAQLAQRPVTEISPVRDCILGARVCGTAYSSGTLRSDTEPGGNSITVELQLSGNIQSRTTSYKKPVRVRSLGSTDFVATKLVKISDERFLSFPATTCADTDTKICSVTKTGGKLGKRLVERIARKKVAESKPQAEYIAARHAEQQINEKFNRQVREAIFQARDSYDQKFRAPLERIGMFPDYLQMASTDAGIQVETTLAAYNQISTSQLPPGVYVDNDFSIRVHESAVNNFFPHLLGGVKIQQDDETQPPRFEGDVPAWLLKATKDPKVSEKLALATAAEPAEDEEAAPSVEFKPWSFLLNSEHPVSVSFEDQQVTLRIRIAELSTLEDGEESVRKNWDFLVTYRLVQDGNRVVLRREGDIEALPTGFDPAWFGDPRWGDKLTGTQVGIRKNLEENINRRAAAGQGFPDEIPLPAIKLPGANNTQISLQLQQLECDGGWLTLGYRLP